MGKMTRHSVMEHHGGLIMDLALHRAYLEPGVPQFEANFLPHRPR